MAAKIITFTGNAVHDKDSWFCRKCSTKFKLGTKIVTKKSKVNNTNHYLNKACQVLTWHA